MDKNNNIVIIGGQGGGMTVASSLERTLNNFNIYVFEEQDYISFGACGLPYYIGGFFNNQNQLFARTPNDYSASKNLFIKTNHRVLSVNENTQSVEVLNLKTQEISNINYSKLIISTGSKANTFGFNNIKNVFTLKTLADALDIKAILSNNIKSIAIIGAGYIGLELLEAIKHFNKNIKITVIDAKENISNNIFDSDFEEVVLNEFKDNNINLYLNEKIKDISYNNTANNVQITTNNKIIQADIAILAMGFSPNTKFVENINFNKIKNGALIVDNFGKTNINNIYALGDCAALKHGITNQYVNIQLATLANKLAKIVAKDIVNNLNNKNIPITPLNTLGSSCIKILNLEFAKTGITKAEAIQNNISFKEAFVKDYNHTDYYPNQNYIYGKILFNPDTLQILGAQLMGKDGAMLRIHALSVAIQTKITLDDLEILDFAYSPPFTRTFEFLNILATVAKKV
jgi:NADPH-dependent 2,4-dienoyl-CoA reductase/sulfur reductase-like enzyme